MAISYSDTRPRCYGLIVINVKKLHYEERLQPLNNFNVTTIEVTYFEIQKDKSLILLYFKVGNVNGCRRYDRIV